MQEVPLCAACNHHHFQGTKCAVCGHVGQSNLYSRMCDRAKSLCIYHVETQPRRQKDSSGMCDVSQELRRQVLCEGGVLSEDLDEFEDSSRCLVGYLGDLPVWTARWRFVPSDDGSSSAFVIVDRLVVLPVYCNQKITTSSENYLFADIHDSASFDNISVSHIIGLVPLGSWISQKLEARGFNISNQTVQCVVRGVSYYHAVLTL